MFKNSRRQMALLLVLAMVLISLAGWQSGTVDAAKKAAFSSNPHKQKLQGYMHYYFSLSIHS